MYRRLKIPIPIWLSGCSTSRHQGPEKRFQAELENEISGNFEKGFEKEIKNGFEIRFGKDLGHGSKIEKSSVAFGFKINNYTLHNLLQTQKIDQRVVVLRKGVMP